MAPPKLQRTAAQSVASQQHPAVNQVLGQPELLGKILAPLDTVVPSAVSRDFHRAYASKALWKGLAERKRPHARPLRDDAGVPELRAWVGTMHKVDKALDPQRSGPHAFRAMTADEHEALIFKGAPNTQGYVSAYAVEPLGHPVWTGPTRPDAQEVAVVDGHATVQLDGGRSVRLPVPLEDARGRVSRVSALRSPSNAHVAIGRVDLLQLFDVTGEVPRLLYGRAMAPELMLGKPETLGPMGWLADGQKLAFMAFVGRDSSSLHVVDAANPEAGSRDLYLAMAYHSARMMVPAPHGLRVAVLGERDTAIFDLERPAGEEFVGELEAPPTTSLERGALHNLGWSPDGQYIARLMPGNDMPPIPAPRPLAAAEPAPEPRQAVANPLQAALFASPFDAAHAPSLQLVPSRVDVWRVSDEAWNQATAAAVARQGGEARLQPKSFPVPWMPVSVMGFHPSCTRIIVREPNRSFVLNLDE